jgi:hypothetical protein
MGTLIAAMITAPVAAISVGQLQVWLESWDYDRHKND